MVPEQAHASSQADTPDLSHAASQADFSPDVAHVGSQADLQQQADQQAAGTQTPAEAQPPPDNAAGSSSSRKGAQQQQQQQQQQSLAHSGGSGIVYAASGAELSVAKAAVGQQLDLLDSLQRRSTGANAGGADRGSGSAQAAGGGVAPLRSGSSAAESAAALMDVKPEDLQDLTAVAQGVLWCAVCVGCRRRVCVWVR
jgi:hypothetical protein